jgi:hypothetical protein
MVAREEWDGQGGLYVSYDVAEAELEVVDRALTGSPGEASLVALQRQLQAAMRDLETRLERGLLTLPHYAKQLRAKILLDKRAAVAHKKAGDRHEAVRLLRHSKLMEHELREALKSIQPAPEPAPAKKEYQSDAARAIQAMMNQFNQDVRRLDRTTAAQQAEIEAELDSVWEQEHGKPA